ncbi:ABC transporter permease subunit [Streptomyces botrytidirepellens]|uniref:ABC transporter permease subunit n=1 Tax=Streptomyces botrytidirepellens TaxID=2486417 RepID=A0A3M8WJ25_9ACTN|nr:ABC transporter permease subunit [Streptomyces botrytidirepellens]
MGIPPPLRRPLPVHLRPSARLCALPEPAHPGPLRAAGPGPGHHRLRRTGQLHPRPPAVGLPGGLRPRAPLRHRPGPRDAAAVHRPGTGPRHALPPLGRRPACRLLPAVRRPRRHRLDPVGLSVRAGCEPDRRRARQDRARPRLPRLRQCAVVHRQHRHLGVRRLQHAGDRRPAQGDPTGAVRGRAHRRGRCLADGGPDQAPAGPARPGAHRRVLHHRDASAVRRTAGDQAAHLVGHQLLHTEPERLQRGVRQQQHLPRRGRIGDPRPGRERAVLRLPQPGEPQGRGCPVSVSKPRGVKPSRILLVALLSLAALYFLLPVYWLVVASTKSSAGLFGSFGLWFSDPRWLHNLSQVFSHDDGIFWDWTWNSILYAGVGGALATLLACAAGYALAVYRFRGREVVFKGVLAGVLLPSTALALPMYLLFSKVGLVNTSWAVLIPSVVSPFGVYLCRIYAEAAVPAEVLEAARIDGAGEWRIFGTLVLRTMTPALVTVFLFQFVGIWNNYFLPLVMLSDDRKYPITLGLTTWQSAADRHPELYQLTVGGAFLSILPLAVAMLILQRYWRSGLTEGSVKG